MRTAVVSRISSVWLFLSGLTIASWGLAVARDDGLHARLPVTLGVIALAMVKGRMIMQHFMEVRTAPRWLGRFTDIWLVTMWAALLAIYLF
jgi:hypothetical protein